MSGRKIRKASVSEKIFELSGLHLKRIQVNLKKKEFRRAAYWFNMLHSLFGLSSSMLADCQMDGSVFSEVNRIHARALKIVKSIDQLKPIMEDGSPGQEGLGDALDTYRQFRRELETMGLV